MQITEITALDTFNPHKKGVIGWGNQRKSPKKVAPRVTLRREDVEKKQREGKEMGIPRAEEFVISAQCLSCMHEDLGLDFQKLCDMFL